MSLLAKALAALLLGYVLLLVVLALGQRTLLYPAPRTAPPLPAGYDEVALRTADGLTLRAAWRPPAPGRETAVFFHGNGGSWMGASVAVQQLADAGYGLLLPHYRGYSGNPGSPSEAGLYMDGRAAMDWLAAKGIASGQLVLIGNSMGSGVATQMAVERPVAGLVLISPFAALDGLVAEKLPYVPVRWLLQDRYDNRAKLPGLKTPLLIMHGTQDRLIPHEHSRRLHAARPDATLRLHAGAGHDLAFEPAAQADLRGWIDAVVQP